MQTTVPEAESLCRSCPHWAEGCGVFRAKASPSVHSVSAPWLHALACPDGRWKHALVKKCRSQEEAVESRRAVCEKCDELEDVPEPKCVSRYGPKFCAPCRIEPWKKMERCPEGRWQ